MLTYHFSFENNLMKTQYFLSQVVLKIEFIYILGSNVYMIFHLQFIVAHVLPFCVRCVHKINGMREYNMYMGLLLPKVFQITHWK